MSNPGLLKEQGFGYEGVGARQVAETARVQP